MEQNAIFLATEHPKHMLGQLIAKWLIEHFSTECHTNKTKAITKANQMMREYNQEPLRTQSKNIQTVSGAGKLK